MRLPGTGGRASVSLHGGEGGSLIASWRRLAARKRKVWLRYVLVPGLTDDLEDIAKIAAFVAGLGNVERVDVLPFHQMGKHKWKKLGLEYKLETVQPPDTDTVERTCAVFRNVGLTTY